MPRIMSTSCEQSPQTTWWAYCCKPHPVLASRLEAPAGALHSFGPYACYFPLQSQFTRELREFNMYEDCPVFDGLFEYCQVCAWSYARPVPSTVC